MTEVDDMLVEKLADHLIWTCSPRTIRPKQQAGRLLS